MTVLPHDLPDFLYDLFPWIQGNSQVEDFIEKYHPTWAVVGIYYNDSVDAPVPVGAGFVIALNQSHFHQLIFSSNETGSTEIRWICLVSGHLMPVNASIILLTAVERFLVKLPNEPIVLYDFHLEVSGGNPPVKKLAWHVWFHVTINGPGDFYVKIDTNGTVLHEGLVTPPSNYPPPAIFPLTFIAVAVVGMIILVLVLVNFIRTHSDLRSEHDKKA